MQLQLIFNEIAEKKMESRDIKKLYKSMIEQIEEHTKLVEQIKELRGKKKQIELKTQAELGTSWDKLEELKNVMDAAKEMMTDVALNDLMAGKTVEVEHGGVKYLPVWSVKFKQVN